MDDVKDAIIDKAPLGKQTSYVSRYAPELLYPIPRGEQRMGIGITGKLPFHGVDTWYAYELSWLNARGKPEVAVGRFDFPCSSANIVESKSFKLYLNSFTNTPFDSVETVVATLERDLTAVAGESVAVKIFSLKEAVQMPLVTLAGECLDDLDISCDTYAVTPSYLRTLSSPWVEELLYSDLLKSNCLITGQPDWASVQIQYRGKQIDKEGLLKYIVSFRDHNEFHEHCVERIFSDIMEHCAPELLVVYARYTRRGGLDINPIRGTVALAPLKEQRLVRQ